MPRVARWGLTYTACRGRYGQRLQQTLLTRHLHEATVLGLTGWRCGDSIRAHHKGIIVDGPVLNVKAVFKEAGCIKISKRGYSGKGPTYCRHHGPTNDCLVLIARPKHNIFDLPGEVSFHVKTEAQF